MESEHGVIIAAILGLAGVVIASIIKFVPQRNTNGNTGISKYIMAKDYVTEKTCMARVEAVKTLVTSIQKDLSAIEKRQRIHIADSEQYRKSLDQKLMDLLNILGNRAVEEE